MMSDRKPSDVSDQKTARELEALDRLDREAASRFQNWSQRGADDPVRALLESFAVVLGELRGELDDSAERLLPRLLAELGHEPLWSRPARSAIRLHAASGLDTANKIPAGTAVTASRADAGESRVFFETAADAWLSPANLEYAVVLEGEESRLLPVDGEDRAPARLFGSDRLNHHLYLGDAEWDELRRYSAELVLEWPGVPGALLEGEWEYSSGTGWRLLPVDFSQTVNVAGDPLVRMRIHGPLPDMTSRELEGFEAPWIRLRLPAGTSVSMATPTLVCSLRRDRKSKQKRALGRPPERIFLRSGNSWQDHSFIPAGGLELAGLASHSRPAVYLGWDRPEAASLYWQAGGGAVGSAAEQPRLEWEFSIEDSFRQLAVVDGTEAFTRSGTISWEGRGDWQRRRLFGRELYWVRASWAGGLYQAPVSVEGLVPCGVEVIEGHTVGQQPAMLHFSESAAVLPPHPEGDFEPFAGLSLLLSSSGGRAAWKTLRAQSGSGVPEPGRFRLRRRADGGVEVVVGEELQGQVKARIEGLRAGIGRAGENIGGRLDVLEYEADGLESISHPVAILGGCGAESAASFQRRLAAESSIGPAVVSGADYRDLLRALDPRLSRIEVVPHPLRPAEVWVVVWGAGCEHPGAQRLRKLERCLQQRAPLGTIVHVVEPLRLPFTLVLGLSGGELSRGQEDELAASLSEFLEKDLDPLAGGASGDGAALVAELSVDDFQARAAAAVSGADVTAELALRIESTLADGASLELPIGLPVLGSVTIEMRLAEKPVVVKAGGIR